MEIHDHNIGGKIQGDFHVEVDILHFSSSENADFNLEIQAFSHNLDLYAHACMF